METWKIAVINDGKNILPFSFEAMATVYEFNRYENSLREKIMNQNLKLNS